MLDDYHVINAPGVHEGMAYLLDHLPPQIHLVIASRADPALPLARLRARGQLVEIRAADLRFTPDEASTYLTGVMGLPLTRGEVDSLEGRTEGWIAALQLAALSMQGRDDVAGFIAGFAGDDRYIVDYLAEEVLSRQPDSVKDFLLQTSMLERLSGPLCDAVTGQGDGRARLAELERGNLFLIPLDDQRRWYRYHQLFADVLQAHLLDEQPALVPELMRRASEWSEASGEPSEAIRYALAAQEFARAADLIERAIPVLRPLRQEVELRGWFTALPADVVRARPLLSDSFAGVLLATGELDGVERLLDDAERQMNPPTGGPTVLPAGSDVAGPSEAPEWRRLPGSIAVHRAGFALVGGDLPNAVRHAQRALDLAPDDDDLNRAAAAALLGIAAWTRGDLIEAERAYVESMAGLQRAGHISDALGLAIALADILLAQGRLSEAMRTYEQALRLPTAASGPDPRGSADMHVGMSEVHLERGELQSATQDLLRSQVLGDHLGLPQNRYRWRVAMARLRQTEGDLDGAVDLLNEAERVFTGDFSPNVRPIPALRARVFLAQGSLRDALEWSREHRLIVEDELAYVREFEHITLARLLLATYAAERDASTLDDATRFLGRLLTAAENGHRTRSVVEILILQAIADQARAGIEVAVPTLTRALKLAEPEGYVRIFADEGPPMAALLRAVEKQGTSRDYVRRLLAAMHASDDTTPPGKGQRESLSERELDVLRLLGTDLNGPPSLASSSCH